MRLNLFEPNLVSAQWVRSALIFAGGNCWFRPLCASSPVVVSGRSRSFYSECCRPFVPGNLTALIAYHAVVPFHHARRPC
ncbi:hypothetical protein BHM03_00061566, partial [Ensete ventricosum]